MEGIQTILRVDPQCCSKALPCTAAACSIVPYSAWEQLTTPTSIQAPGAFFCLFLQLMKIAFSPVLVLLCPRGNATRGGV